MRSWLGLAALVVLNLGVSGCGRDTSTTKGLLGTYEVMISKDGKSDSDIMSVVEGASNSLLLTFIAGIDTDPMGANPNGLRCGLQATAVTVLPQPCHISHSSGELDGTVKGEGTLAADGSSVNITLHYMPTNLAGAAVLDYVITGAKSF